MALDKQIHIYSVDTSAFYTEEEQSIHQYMSKLYKFRNHLNNLLDKKKNKLSDEQKIRYQKYITNTNRRVKKHKARLCETFKKCSSIRQLNEKALNDYNIVSIFDSALTRTIEIPINSLSKDIIIVQTYFFDVIEDIIVDGFLYNNEKYICLTASAGQIRTKKTVFIKESAWLKHKNTLMCGLTVEDINKYGGVNINKFLAYLALSNSATDLWKDFDITKTIVVNDMETMVRGIVDFIDDRTYEITRKEMDILINHTDGCGMILPRKSKKNFMVRLPWVKGLLVSFPFDKYIQELNEQSKGTHYGMVTDIFGKKHDILKEGIEVIFTKSQFKMYKYYTSWEQYIDNFLKYNCQAGKCNEEEDFFSNAKINYQMLQTLTDMTDEELKELATKTKEHIKNIGKDRKTMLKVLGVKRSNRHKNYMQQAIELYPELLNDTYNREILKQVKKSLVKEGRAGKLEIEGKYTFISPDLYAFCEFLILGDKNPKGLLKDQEVFCKLYDNGKRLDCLRSPHLYREHALRNNIMDDERSKWFTTNALYTSCHDLISKILQFDVDGDKSLVCANKTLISVAERNMEDIVPLFYNMSVAKPQIINSKNIYYGLKAAYTGGNIGDISNNITKIWNSDDVNLDIVKFLCLENNFVIDYAKTLYKPERPSDKKTLITKYTKLKVPHFFIYAKDKTKDKVEKINNSVVNRLEKIIENPRINFESVGLNSFDYKMLMKNKEVEIDESIIEKYKELDLKNRFISSRFDFKKTNDKPYIYDEIKNKILEVNSDIYYVVDVLVEYLYKHKKSNHKTTLWSSFGDIIVENLRNNVKVKYIYCNGKDCGDLVEKSNNKLRYCGDCSKVISQQQKNQWKREKWKGRKIENP